MIETGLERRWLAALVVALACGAAAACSAESTEPSPSAGGSSGTSATSGSGGTPSSNAGTPATGGVVGTAGTSTTAGTGGTSVSAAGTGNSGGNGGSGGGVTMPLCTSKVTLETPTIADFETYDGVVAPADFQWIFGGAAAGELGVHAGTYAFGDGSAEPMLALLAGHGGNYGLTVSVTNASKWGEGFGMFLLDKSYAAACIDASKYKGISLWVRGMVPTNTFSLSVSMAQGITTAKGGSCTGTDDATCKPPTASNLPVSSTWTQVDVLWSDLTGGLSGPDVPLAANGDNITGFSFGANLVFMPESEGSMTYVPVPGDVSIAIDDLTFIP